jgi:DNA polymerase-3 subunit alpha
MAALLTSDFGNLERIAIEIAECKRLGITIIPPNVNASFVEFGVVPETGEIIFSLAAIKGIGVGMAEAIQEERTHRGPFRTLEDFIERIPRQFINKKTLECLIKSGALDSFGERRQLLEGIPDILRYADYAYRQKQSLQHSLFAGLAQESSVAIRLPNVEPASKKERLQWEKEFLGLYLSDHPLADYLPILARSAMPIREARALASDRRVTIGGMVASAKRIITKTGRPMLFSEIEGADGKIEVVVFPDVLERNPSLWREENIILVEGRINHRNGSASVICEDAHALSLA